MARHEYKGITFAEGWNGTFDQFREQFENTHVFKGITPKERAAEMKAVFNDIIALNKAEAKEEAKEEAKQ